MAKSSFNAPRKVLVAVPSGGTWDPKFGMSLARLVRAYSDPKLRVKMVLSNTVSSMLGNNREKLLIQALKLKCTHILFIDDDMVFVVAVDVHDEFVNLATCESLVKVRSVGLAFALIKLEPLKKSQPPHFMMEWIPGEKKQCGEDVYFCAKWDELGEEVWIHREASRALGHVGSYTYTWEDVKDGSQIS